MSKKHKKKSARVSTAASKLGKGERVGSRVKMITCVECPRGNVVTPMSKCKDCEFHDNDYCTLVKEKKRIRSVSLSEPMKFNRMTFQVSSEHIQDDARNYYFLTEIMTPVKNITDCEPYTNLKTRLLSGELCERNTAEPACNIKIKAPIIYLEKTESGACMVYGGQGYKEVEPFDTGEEWEIVYYLYEMFSYSGLADMMIDDRSFKVKLSQVVGYPEQALVVKRGDKIIIGERSGGSVESN